MSRNRLGGLLRIMKGLGAAVGLTLLLMAGLAALVLALRISDQWLTALNQVMKLCAIVLGALVAIGRGGERGFLTGMALAMLYMTLGYAGYVLLGGAAFQTSEMLGEILIGAAVGAITGAILSNLPARGARRARAV